MRITFLILLLWLPLLIASSVKANEISKEPPKELPKIFCIFGFLYVEHNNELLRVTNMTCQNLIPRETT